MNSISLDFDSLNITTNLDWASLLALLFGAASCAEGMGEPNWVVKAAIFH
jgi:hypothetical protein